MRNLRPLLFWGFSKKTPHSYPSVSEDFLRKHAHLQKIRDVVEKNNAFMLELGAAKEPIKQLKKWEIEQTGSQEEWSCIYKYTAFPSNCEVQVSLESVGKRNLDMTITCRGEYGLGLFDCVYWIMSKVEDCSGRVHYWESEGSEHQVKIDLMSHLNDSDENGRSFFPEIWMQIIKLVKKVEKNPAVIAETVWILEDIARRCKISLYKTNEFTAYPRARSTDDKLSPPLYWAYQSFNKPYEVCGIIPSIEDITTEESSSMINFNRF